MIDDVSDNTKFGQMPRTTAHDAREKTATLVLRVLLWS